MKDAQTICDLIQELASYGVPGVRAQEIVHDLIVIGKEAQEVAREQERRAAYRELALRSTIDLSGFGRHEQ